MFSVRQKQEIAAKVEEILLSFRHPEMPTECPRFTLQIYGKEAWSWATIVPNWTFTDEQPPAVNQFNELQDPGSTIERAARED